MPKPVIAVKMPDAVTLITAPTKEEMHQMLAHAGAAHHIDEDLLASVVRAESGGQVKAVSRTGARGLMQLMPGTASAMGVDDAFQPQQNIAGGTAYLDVLLTRYHDNVALALAAYNAGPGAVDRYHGIPPYRETREYVARVIREFNRRKQIAVIAQSK
jgi:soluble lytic murein transglycosylase-like protein